MRHHQIRSAVGNRGLAPLIIILIVVAALAALGGGYFAVRSSPLGAKLGLKPATSEKGPAGQAGSAAAGDAIDNLTVTAPEFDYSTSSLPELNFSAANPGAPGAVGMSGFTSGVSLNTDFSYGLDLNVPLPAVEFNVTAAPATAPSTEQSSSGESQVGQDSGSQGGSLTPSTSNCAQFSGVPSCSYVGDPNGKALCEACKAAGF